MMRIAVCDDIEQQAETILSMLKKYSEANPELQMELSYFASGAELLEAVDDGCAFDLFFLDILMPGQNGIEVAREIRARDDKAIIVFLTAAPDYTMDAFRIYALQYLLKPVAESELFSVLDKATSLLNTAEDKFFLLQMPERAVRIPFNSIVCVELSNRSMRLYHADGGIWISKNIRVPFRQAVAPLLADRRFLYAHVSFVINMGHVEALTNSGFIMKHDLEVPVPRSKYAEAKKDYFKWIS